MSTITTPKLTPRQREIMTLLEQRKNVPQIAAVLGVTKNAIYLQLQKMRSRGLLPPDFTATGRAPREQYRPAMDLHFNDGPPPVFEHAVNDDEFRAQAATAAARALMEELRRTRDELRVVEARLTRVLAD